MQPLLVVVTGAPGAGKSSLAEPLARELGLPLLAKDPLKETLHDALGGEGREWSQRLGAATFAAMFHILGELLASGCSVVAEGNFSRAEPFLDLPPARIVQLYVSAPADVVSERFRSRNRTHPVHYDLLVIDEVPLRMASGEWDPLEIGGTTISIDGTQPVDVAAIAARIREGA